MTTKKISQNPKGEKSPSEAVKAKRKPSKRKYVVKFDKSGFYLAFMIMFIFNGALRGAGDTLIPMFITLFALWVIRIPVSSYLSTIIGTKGIWWGIPIAWVIGALFTAIYFATGRWKRNVLVKRPGKELEAREIIGEIECAEWETKEFRP
ncbi:MAG: hypothetical protein CVV50_01065 [Spirochaetae bacterium HGW-Spirochaetae-6]|nr:MAG: hypothetical protein CVV50_01065 [Spirochaetae bacterium HGW-Spirochaetae-6]